MILEQKTSQKINPPKEIPSLPGVYVFRDSSGKTLYVGKAGNLKSRLGFYFQRGTKQSPRIIKLLKEAARLTISTTDSEIEALVKEAALIKKLQPKYNILMRDDKNYFYVGITHEEFPKIFITHQPRKSQKSKVKSQNCKSKFKISSVHNVQYIGPFTSGGDLKSTITLLRRAFPFCTCKNPHKRPCLNAEMGRCLGYCCVIREQETENKEQKKMMDAQRKRHERKEYQKNIANIVSVLRGKKISAIKRALKHELAELSKTMEYERAAIIRDQIAGLNAIARHKEILRFPADETKNGWAALEPKIRALFGKRRNKNENNKKRRIYRVEGYDIANISGMSATGSMAVFRGGIPEKNEYRKFKIKAVSGANDVAMIAEIIRRRLRHPEWPFPDIMVIDGGKPQINAALTQLSAFSDRLSAEDIDIRQKAKNGILITALAKQNEELYVAGRKYPIPLKKQPREIMHFFQRVRDEAHRFARVYHHKLREKNLAQSNEP